MALSLENVQRKKAVKVRSRKSGAKKKTIRPWEATPQPGAVKTGAKANEQQLPLSGVWRHLKKPLLKIFESKDRFVQAKPVVLGYSIAVAQIETWLAKNPSLKGKIQGLGVCAKVQKFSIALNTLEKRVRAGI